MCGECSHGEVCLVSFSIYFCVFPALVVTQVAVRGRRRESEVT